MSREKIKERSSREMVSPSPDRRKLLAVASTLGRHTLTLYYFRNASSIGAVLHCYLSHRGLNKFRDPERRYCHYS